MNSSIGTAMHRLIAKDGHELDCWIVPTRGVSKGGLVILQEIFGITDQLKKVAQHYAEQGMDVAIPALFDRHQRETVIPFDQAPRGRDLAQIARMDETLADIEAAVKRLSAQTGKVAIVGFCWGGGLALCAAQRLDIAGAVSYYGTHLAKYLDRPLAMPMLFHCGKQDNHTSPELMTRLQAAFPSAEFCMYDAGHAFANDARSSHVPAAAELANRRTANFLSRVLS